MALAALPVAWSENVLAESARQGRTALDGLLAALPREGSIRVLGQALQVAGRVEHGSNALRSVLAETLERQAGANTPISLGELCGRLLAAIRSDFVTGETVMIEGWMLSKTEARLYALIACEPGDILVSEVSDCPRVPIGDAA